MERRNELLKTTITFVNSLGTNVRATKAVGAHIDFVTFKAEDGNIKVAVINEEGVVSQANITKLGQPAKV